MNALVLLQVDEAIKAAFGFDAGTDSTTPITRAISEGTGAIKTGRYES